MPIEKERRSHFSIGNVLTMLTIAGALAGVYAANAADNARQKERVDNLKEEVREIKNDVKETKRDVQLILRKIDSMDAAQRTERRESRNPRSETIK